MQKRKSKRIAALLTAGMLLLSTLPVNILAVEKQDRGGLCEHHAEHNEECGYSEGASCRHEHGEDCVILVTKCVHEHTEACYPAEMGGEVPENSITRPEGEAGPTKCRHTCSEETGCITEQADCPHDRGEHDEDCGYAAPAPCAYVCGDCAQEGGGADGEELESETEPETGTEEESGEGADLTACTCTELCEEGRMNADCPVCGAQDAVPSACEGLRAENVISDWEWIDPEQNLTDGELALPGVSAEHQADFETVVSMLPEGISAIAEGGEREEIPLSGWSCAAYRQDGNGRWPVEGEYLFTGRLPEGYALSEQAERMEVKVSLGGAEQFASDTGELAVEGGVPGKDYAYEGNVLTVLTGKTLVISGSTETDRIVVDSGCKGENAANVILDGVSIDVSRQDRVCAFLIEKGAVCSLILDGENMLESGYGKAGLELLSDAELTIAEESAGKLQAFGGESGAGIGGGYTGSCGTIIINGGTVEATGGNSGAGIGSGSQEGNCGAITISGGTVEVTGGSSGAGIGSGWMSGCGAITISGGTVEATGGINGAGIGSGIHGSCEAITISGGIVEAESCIEMGAGIGGGYNGSCGAITISGGTVEATGSENGAGIGSGFKGSYGAITISGGTVEATGDGSGAGIGSGKFGENGSESQSDSGDIIISGGIVTATSGGLGAGIGSGGQGSCGAIMISGGTVEATGGSSGAGIGSGYLGGCGTITVLGGTVTAGGGSGGAGIGNSQDGGSSSFSTSADGKKGNAFIIASSISDVSGKDKDDWSGVIFIGDSGEIYGSQVLLTTDAEIPTDKTLTIGAGKELIIDTGVTLTNRGEIAVVGGGKLTNSGVLLNYGKITPEYTDGGTVLDKPSSVTVAFEKGGGSLENNTAAYCELITITATVKAEQTNTRLRKAPVDYADFYLGGTDGILLGTADVTGDTARLTMEPEVWKKAGAEWNTNGDSTNGENTITVEFVGGTDDKLLPSTGEGKLTVTPVSLEGATVILSKSEEPVVYRNEVYRFGVKEVRLEDHPFTLDQNDYSVSYSRNDTSSDKYTSVGTVIVTVTGKGCYTGTAKATYQIQKSAAEITVKTFSDAEGTKEEATFTYAKTITVKAVVKPTGELPKEQLPVGQSPFGLRTAGLPSKANSLEAPKAGEAALYVRKSMESTKGTEDIQLTGPQPVIPGVKLTFSYDTSLKGLVVGKNILVVKYVGDPNMADAEQTAEVELEQKELTPTVTGTAEKTYDGTAEVFGNLAVTFSDMVVDDKVSVKSGSFAYEDATAGDNKAIHITELSGNDSGWYKLPSDYSITGKINKVDPVVTTDVSLSGSGGSRQAVLTVTVKGVKKGEAPTGTVTLTGDGLNHTVTLPSVSAGNEGTAEYTWEGLSDQEYTVSVKYSGDTNYKECEQEKIIPSYTESEGGSEGGKGEDEGGGNGGSQEGGGTSSGGQTGGTASDSPAPAKKPAGVIEKASGSQLTLGGTTIVTVSISAATLDRLVREQTAVYQVQTPALGFGFGTQTLEQLERVSGGGDIILQAVQTADPTGAGRPAWNMTLVSRRNGTDTPISLTGGSAVSVQMAYTPAPGEQPGSLYIFMAGVSVNQPDGLFLPDESGKQPGGTYLPGMPGIYASQPDGSYLPAMPGQLVWLRQSAYDPVRQAVLFAFDRAGLYGVGYQPFAPVFSDIRNHPAKDDILFAAGRGMLTGIGNGKFGPDAEMTRGMLATALGVLSGIETDSGRSGGTAVLFTDVEINTSYAPYVNWAVENGIMTGTTATTFSPDLSVNREQMAVVLNTWLIKTGKPLAVLEREALGSGASGQAPFADKALISPWAEPSVQVMRQAGILSNQAENLFNPWGTVTRAEAATVLRRLVELTADPSVYWNNK